jgi:malonyl-CoA/methylmalonyl-CoA synthetase
MSAQENLILALYSAREADTPLFVSSDGSSLTTLDALQRIRRLGGLLSDLGVVAGDRISLRLAKSADAILLAHACIWIGGIVHPLNTSYTDHEISLLLLDAKPRLLVCDESEVNRFEAIVREAGARLVSVPRRESIERARAIPAYEPVSVEDPAALLYTSGTTGRPKGALITHRNLLDSARSLASVWELTRKDILLHPLPVYHAHGLLTSINAMLACGGAVCLLPAFDVNSVISSMQSCTVLMAVPTHYARLLEEPTFGAHSVGKLRVAISGSAPLPLELAREFHRRTCLAIIERYGSTETAIVVAVPPGQRERTGWVGWPLPGVEIRVKDREGGRSLRGLGSLETRGPNVFAGYWNNDSATAAAFSDDGWFLTGDIAEIDDEGCVRILGREKDIVITGGLNVYPAEVEDELRRLPRVKDAAVFGVPHQDFGEAVVAAVELAPSDVPFDQTSAIAALRSRLAAFKIPKRIFAVHELPRNAMGKLLKANLREDHANTFLQPSAEKGFGNGPRTQG